MAHHIDTVAILIGVYSLLQLMIACLLGGIYGLMGGGAVAIGFAEQEIEAVVGGGVFMVFAMFIFVLLLLQPVLGALAAFGIRRRTTLGRILGFVVCALAVLNMPIGTIVGIFGFVVLIDKEAAKEFTDQGRAEYFT